MKAGVLAVAAAMATGAMGKLHAVRHKHGDFHLDAALEARGKSENSTCGCTTIYTTITGEGTLYFPPTTTLASMSAPPTPVTTQPATTSTVVVVPTPFATTCPTPGVYTIPATTITLTESTTVCGASSTSVPSGGVYTAGGVVTVVETETTVVCPYATTSSSNGVVTSTILTTTYVCPSAGTYTIAPLTTTVSESTVWVYPTPTSYAPGTYTQVEVVTTITETDYVIVCPYTSPAPVAASPTSPAVVVSAPVVPAPVATTPTQAAPGGSLGSPGGKWAITYSPYNNDESCKDASSVEYDISIIAGKGFSAIRVYSTDCSTLTNVGAACEKYGLKLVLGVFISETGCSGAAEQVTQIVAWGKWSLVELIVIGNEAVFGSFASASELASFISSSKSALQGAGYTGLITTTEPLDIWQENASVLCAVVDVVGCNIHPFFNGDIDAASAGSFVASQLQIVDTLCPGKYGVNLETGWPSQGTCNGVACPGSTEQATAVAGIQQHAGDKSVMFSYTNDYWKAPGAFNCEQSWGSINLFN